VTPTNGTPRRGRNVSEGALPTELSEQTQPRLRIIGPGDGVDLLLIATPDATIAEVAAAVRPGDAVVAHQAARLAGHPDRPYPVPLPWG
jgi:hypothetical protein